jgi:hypothetical protein
MFTKQQYDPSSPDYVFVPINKEESLQAANNLVKTLPTGNSLTLDPQKTRYSNLLEGYAKLPPEKASVVTYTYNSLLHGFPVVLSNSPLPAVEVAVDGNNQILSFTYVPQSFSELSSTIYPTITTSEAVQNINNGNARLLYAQTEGAIPLQLSELSQGKLQNVIIEYRMENNQQGEQTLMPYYNFTGTAVDAGGNAVSVTILTPAIQTRN